MADFSFIDLFAGIGGFRLALESVGGHCLGFSEIAPDAINTYCANFNETEDGNFGDITKIKDLPRHDFMTAGVPCQSWSIAGKNLGFDDDRGQLWNDTLYLLNKVRPKAFIFENVKGLSDPRNQKALEYILARIQQAGYHAQKFVLNAYDYGVPQTRVRIYIIGFRDEMFLKRLQLPKPFPGEVRLNDVLDSEITMACEDGPETRPRWSCLATRRDLMTTSFSTICATGQPLYTHGTLLTQRTEKSIFATYCCVIVARVNMVLLMAIHYRCNIFKYWMLLSRVRNLKRLYGSIF